MNYRKSRTIVYRAEQAGPGKWIFALIVFILAMTITWAEVEGINIPTTPQDSTKVANRNMPTSEPSELGQTVNNPPEEPTNPNPLPEPGTILLLSAGLGAAYLIRRKRV